MAKVKGYYNVNNGIFLGPVTAKNEDTGEAVTPRFVEGVCFGEYDTDTDSFVPLTNPMHIPTGMIYTQDEQINKDGKLENIRTGIIEDVGADIVTKGFKNFVPKRTSNVVTKDASGKIYPDKAGTYVPKAKAEEPKEEPKPKGIVAAEKPKFFLAGELDSLDLDNLF